MPVEITRDSYCNFSMGDKHAKLIRETDLMIWDEAPMGHKYILVIKKLTVLISLS